MTVLVISGQELRFNNNGYLADFDAWSKDIAEALAAEAGLTLSGCHWTVIEFLRDYYSEYEHPPSPRLVIRGIGERITMNAPCTRRTLESLFPNGGCKEACRIAGLPDYYCHSC